MKVIEDALELADDIDECPYFDKGTGKVIRRLVEELDKQEYRRTHEGFSTILDKVTPQTKPLSDEEIKKVWLSLPYDPDNAPYIFARAIEERHGIK